MSLAPFLFFPFLLFSSISSTATVSDIDSTRSTRLEHPLLDARHGGPIATQAGERASLPVKSLYRIRLTLAEPLPEHREARGVALISGQSRVTLWEGVKHLAAVVVRESSRRVDKRSASTKKAGDHPVAAAPVFLGSEVRVASGKGGGCTALIHPTTRSADLAI